MSFSHPIHWSAKQQRLAGLALLSFLCFALFFYRLGDRELSSSHEARAAQNADSVLTQGTWALPRLFNGRPELQKPPLYYWLIAFFARWNGGVVDGWCVRVPAALSGMGCVLLLYGWGCQRGRPLAGFLAALILATCVHFTWLARVGRIDIPLTLTITIALLGFSAAGERRLAGKPAWWCLATAYLAIAVGFLFKGPIALALPLAVIVIFQIGQRFLRTPNGPAAVPSRPWSSLWWGVPLVLAVAAPWFVWANYQTNNDLWYTFFWYHNVERGFGSGMAHHHPWWFYGPRLFLDLLPWSLVFPFAVWIVWRNRDWRGKDPESRFGLVWLMMMTVVLSLMRFKRADYLLPAYPGAALWLGCVLEKYWRERTPVQTALRARRLSFALVLLISAMVVGWWTYLTSIEPRQERRHLYAKFAAEIRQRTSNQVIFFRTEAHELVFKVGRPLDTILEWENLDVWASRPAVYVVMPPDCVRDWPRHLHKGRLEEVLRTTDLDDRGPDRPLVLLRSLPPLGKAGETY